MKDNIEIIDFLNLPQTSENLKNQLEIAQKNIYDVCRAYRITLEEKLNTIESTMRNLSENTYNNNEIKELKNLCDDLKLKIKLIENCNSQNPVKLIQFCKSVSLRKATKIYIKDFSKDAFVKKYIKKYRFDRFIAVMMVISTLSLLLFGLSIIAWPIATWVLKITWSYYFGCSAGINCIIFIIMISIMRVID
jgi:tRNA A37 threonylcarbamoyladenosine dehydratase